MTDGNEDGNEEEGAPADRLDGLRSTLDEATGSVSAALRDAGGTLDDATADARRNAGEGVRTVARHTREGLDSTRASLDAVREDVADGDDRPTDRPVAVTRTGLDTARRSARQAGDVARSFALDGALPVRRAAADAGLRVRSGVSWGTGEMVHTVRNADTRQVALWGVGTSLALSNPAIAASYSTYALLSAAMAAGMGIGAYVSSHEDTPLDGVDPLALGLTARSGSRSARRVGGRAALAGATVAVGRALAGGAKADAAGEIAAGKDEAEGGVGVEHARWLADADLGTILDGARRAAAHEDDPWAPVFGAGLGLLAGYAGEEMGADADGEAVRRLLDDDLREEFDERTRELDSE